MPSPPPAGPPRKGAVRPDMSRLRTPGRASLSLVPPLYLLLVFPVQPADVLGEPGDPPWMGRLLYDDYDVTAMILRGANASLGRWPGRTDEPPYVDGEAFAKALDDQPPLAQ